MINRHIMENNEDDKSEYLNKIFDIYVKAKFTDTCLELDYLNDLGIKYIKFINIICLSEEANRYKQNIINLVKKAMENLFHKYELKATVGIVHNGEGIDIEFVNDISHLMYGYTLNKCIVSLEDICLLMYKLNTINIIEKRKSKLSGIDLLCAFMNKEREKEVNDY